MSRQKIEKLQEEKETLKSEASDLKDRLLYAEGLERRQAQNQLQAVRSVIRKRIEQIQSLKDQDNEA